MCTPKTPNRVERKRFDLLTFDQRIGSGGDKVSKDQDRRDSDRIMFNPIKDQCLGECRSSESIKAYGGPTAGRDGMAHNVEHREVKLGANRVCKSEMPAK